MLVWFLKIVKKNLEKNATCLQVVTKFCGITGATKKGRLPNLSKLTTGEYIDLEEYCKEPIENLHTIMSILYRKVTIKRGDRYAIEDYDPDEFKEELFKGCPMDIALSCLGFFLTLGKRLVRSSHNFLEAQKKKPQKA